MNITLLKYSQVSNGDKSKAWVVDFDSITKEQVRSDFDKAWLPAFQNTNAGFRVAKYDEKYFDYWNGWVFVDIDHIETDTQEMIEMLHKELQKFPMYKASQRSNGENGIHIYFYIEPYWHTVEEYYAFAVLCYNIVFNYIDIKYFDEHNFIHSQTFKISKRQWYINENFNANDAAMMVQTSKKMSEYCANIRNMCPTKYDVFIKEANKSISDYHNGGKITIAPERTSFVYKVNDTITPNSELQKFHLNHQERYGVICALMNFYNNDKVKALSVYSTIMDYHLDGKHDNNWYKHEYDNIDENKQYIAIPKWTEWLEHNFGITVKAFNSDNIIELKDKDDYLFLHKEEVLDKLKVGINMIIAGTGTGKTEFWKSLNKEICNDILAVNELPILVVEPYNSITDGKYNPNEINKIIRSCHFPKEITNNMMYVTNYDHINSDIKSIEDWSRFRYIVIDESHLLTKEAFRANTLVPFINKLKEIAKSSIVILQTGTPMDEVKLFDDINIIEVTKKDVRNIKYTFLKYDREGNENKYFNINYLSDLTKSLVNDGKKVYIYWNNGEFRKMKKFKEYNSNLKIAIYHKGNVKDKDKEFEEDMKWIDNNHCLSDKYDVLLSSVYFGVGNDLNDTTDAAVIIIGNNTWQEDIQCIGRWRKSPNIDVYCVLDNDRYEWSIEDEYDRILAYKQKNILYNYNDKTNREKSISIGRNTFFIENEENIPIYALMSVCEQYNSTIEYKCIKLKEYGIDISIDFQTLKFEKLNEKLENKIKAAFRKIRNKEISETLSNLLNDGEILTWYNSDSKVVRWQKKVSHVYYIDKDLFNQLLEDGFLSKVSNTDCLSLFCTLVNKVKDNELDAAEIEAWKWYSKRNKELIAEGKDPNLNYENFSITVKELNAATAYTYFVHYKNKCTKDYIILGDYFPKFYECCELYSEMHPAMIEYLQYIHNEKKLEDEFDNVNEEMDVLGLDKIDLEEFYQLKDITWEYKNNPFDTDKYVERSKFFNKLSEKVFLNELLKKLENKHLNAGRKGKEIVVDGVTYKNKADYALKNKISKGAASKRLKKLGIF